ncbi:hypothetical protein QTP70_031355 [Hemibagrus guttatus]|uniref:C-type lectin domain-containing protein n=1 Tax=Hemibagrus guttatus TaxID=175788 RepID=A0AAE0UIU9_9TELE|nr:hypothetical protein QTP70_031355 [Hemibagrus guttatus]
MEQMFQVDGSVCSAAVCSPAECRYSSISETQQHDRRKRLAADKHRKLVDFSSAFNTIIPTLLQTKLTQLSVPSSICQWITSFLTDRHQLVKLGKFTSYSHTTSTGAPLLFSLYTNDCTSTDPSVKLLKFADDTTIIGLIQDGDESAYRQEVEQLAAWCSLNNLELNTLKTVEMILDDGLQEEHPCTPPTHHHEQHCTNSGVTQMEMESDGDYTIKQRLRYFVTKRMGWNEARQECRSRGADLVIINSREEQEYLSQMVTGEAWIGLSDSAEEGKWMWVDGTTMTTGFWWQGEPNDYDGIEDCAATGSKFAEAEVTTWADYPCGTKLHAICEKKGND